MAEVDYNKILDFQLLKLFKFINNQLFKQNITQLVCIKTVVQ